MTPPRPRAETLHTARLTLEPLRADHAEEAARTFNDPALHTYIGGSPSDAGTLRARYERQAVGHSPDGSQTWLNWMVRRTDTGELVGTVQTTLSEVGPDAGTAEVAWIIATGHQGHGYAQEAAAAMVTWLRRRPVGRILAHLHPEHAASAGVARALGLQPTGVIVDGEQRWATT